MVQLDQAAEAVSEERGRVETARDVIALSSADARTVSLVILAVLACLYTLYVAAEIILPLILAVLLNLLLTPAKRVLTERLRIPAPLSALLLILLLFSFVAAVGFTVSLPASNWIAKAPQSLTTLQERLGFLARPLDMLHRGVEQVQHLLQPAPPQEVPTVAVQQSPAIGGVGITILQGTRAALGQVLTLVVLLFFLLVAGGTLLRGVVEILPSFGDKRRAVEIAHEIERNISGYLVTISLMNFAVGIANGVSMWVQGMPDPLLWGTLAFLLNYIPILGPLAGMVIFFFVGLFSTNGIWPALLPPAVYLVIHILEGESITPMLLARRLTLNPVLVIVSLFFWDWMWGVAGAFLAVPMLAVLKIICDHIEPLMPIGHLLGASEKGGSQAPARA
jgi:predicted PurR-regulated permease PerM